MSRFTISDKELFVENKVIELINRGYLRSDAENIAEEQWLDRMEGEEGEEGVSD